VKPFLLGPHACTLFLVGVALIAGCATTPDEEVVLDLNDPIAVLEHRAGELNAAIASDPGNAENHYRLGNTLLDLGRPNEARAAYAACLAIDSQRADALCNMGLALRHIGLLDGAIVAYRQALTIEPNDTVTLANLHAALLLAEHDAEAAEVMGQLYILSPNDLAVAVRRADDLFRQEAFVEAAEIYRRIANALPEHDHANYQWGLSHFRIDDYDNAIAAWLAALKHNPQNALVLKALPVLYWKQGDYTRAWDGVRQCQTKGISLDAHFITQLQTSSGQIGPD
jgi:tetratricopeptide (TPR) repeat protein